MARATGDYLAFMDHDDLLAPHALFEMARAVVHDPTLDVLYSDEETFDPNPGKVLDRSDWKRSPVRPR